MCGFFIFWINTEREHLPDMGYTTLKGKDLGVTLIIWNTLASVKTPKKKIDFHNANTLLKSQNVNSKIWCLIAYFSSIRNFNNCFSAVPSSCVCLVNYLFFFVYKILRKSCLAWGKRWINQNSPSEITNSYHCDDKRPCKS